MVAFLPPSCAAAHLPMDSPAAKLSVENVMSTESAGSGAVSSAMTKRPASRAFWIASRTEGPLIVMRMPLSPFEMAFSMAWICVSSSPSALPAASVRSMPSFAAASFAPSSIATKKGFVVVFTMSETPTSPEPPLPPDPDPPLELEQPASPPAAMRAAEPRAMVRTRRGDRFVIDGSCPSGGSALPTTLSGRGLPGGTR